MSRHRQMDSTMEREAGSMEMTEAPSPTRIETELGQELRCAQCGEYWPADSEFFAFRNGRPRACCKACQRAERKTQAKRPRGSLEGSARRTRGVKTKPTTFWKRM